MSNVIDMKGKPMSDAMLAGLSAVINGGDDLPDMSYDQQVELALMALMAASSHLDVASQLCKTEKQVKDTLTQSMSIKMLAGMIRVHLKE